MSESPPDPDPLESLSSVVGTLPSPDSGTLGPVFDTGSVVSACSSDPELSIAGATVFDAEPRRSEVPDLGRGVEACASTTAMDSSTLVTVAGTVDVSAGTVVSGGTVDVEVVTDETVTSADSSGAGVFVQTERDVGAPKLGNSVSRIAYAVPADPINARAASAPMTALVDREFQLAEPRSDGATTSRARHPSHVSQRLTVAVPTVEPASTHDIKCALYDRTTTIRRWS